MITTADGSHSFKIEDWGETYHSIHGALQEALHVYIRNGFSRIEKNPVRVLEMGFGTGLNAFLTYLEADSIGKEVLYHGVEGFPIEFEETEKLNYSSIVSNSDSESVFRKIHQMEWGKEIGLTPFFTLKKIEAKFEDVELMQGYDLIYFDVFGFPYQPELWTESIFSKMYAALSNGGLLVTYASRGVIKRAMKEVGFKVQICSGPPGKREMTLAWKE